MSPASEQLWSVLEFAWVVLRVIGVLIVEGARALLPKKKKNMHGEVVLITGSGQGMGRQVAFDLSRLGARVVLWDVNEAKVKEVAEAINKEGGSATWYVCDVTSESAVGALAKRVEKEVGEVTILLNNAGIMQNQPILKLDSSRIKLTFEVNVLAHFWTIRAFLPNMEKRNRGHIVALASGAGLVGQVHQTDYSASKFAVVGMMEALSEELRMKRSDIKITTICPLTVATGLNNNPQSKHTWLMPIVSVEDAARQIVSAIRKEEFLVSIPKGVSYSLAFARMCPRRALTVALDYIDYCRVPNTTESITNGKNGVSGHKKL